ncbi:hypothetical protein ACN9TC_13350 [Lactococcus lactis]
MESLILSGVELLSETESLILSEAESLLLTESESEIESEVTS